MPSYLLSDLSSNLYLSNILETREGAEGGHGVYRYVIVQGHETYRLLVLLHVMSE